MLAWSVLCALALETFSEGLHRLALRFLVLFGNFLLQVVTMKYLDYHHAHTVTSDLHKQALEFFEAILLQVLFHHLSHPILYQQTLEI